jgi:hypothetical protein
MDKVLRAEKGLQHGRLLVSVDQHIVGIRCWTQASLLLEVGSHRGGRRFNGVDGKRSDGLRSDLVGQESQPAKYKLCSKAAQRTTGAS